MGIKAKAPSLTHAALGFLPLTGTATLFSFSLMGPTSLASMSAPWALTFLAALTAVALWWSGYLWLLGRLAGWSWEQGLRRSLLPLLVLSASLVVDALFLLSNRLPYSLIFDSTTQALCFRVLAVILMLTLAAQELVLLEAGRSERLSRLVAAACHRLTLFPIWLSRLPGKAVAEMGNHPLQTALLLILLWMGASRRWEEIGAAQPGDMNVLLSVVFTILGWPPVRYYHDYSSMPWVYNHLPAFPLMAAPLYWVFENLLNLPTIWSVKILTGLADLVIAVLLYSRSRHGWRGIWGLAMAGAWLMAPWVIRGNDHPISPAVAFTLAAFVTLRRGWLCGLLLALGVATRNEVAFLVLPVALHFATRRGLAQSVAFLGAFTTTLALIVAPFALYDLDALDYALRRQLQRDASSQVSMVGAALFPYLNQGTAALLQQNPSLPALGLNLAVALLALRDPRVARVAAIAALGYLLTLPLVHERYTLFAFAMGLFYAARYSNPLVAVATMAMAMPPLGYSEQALIGLFAGLVLAGLLRSEKAPNAARTGTAIS